MSVVPIKNVSQASSGGLSWKLILPVAAVVALVLALVAWRFWNGAAPVAVGSYFSVAPMPMDIKVVKDGELQSINNIDIVCRVEGQTTITWVVKEGASVKRGETVLTLDSSAISLKLEDGQLDLQRAQADLTAAREQLDIQKGTNAANLQGAQVELTLAQLSLQEYTQGVYPQLLGEAQRAVKMAQIAVNNKQDDLRQTQSLFAKGFVMGVDVKKDELDLLTAQNDLTKKTTDLKVLTEYTHEKDLTSKKNALAQAEQKLQRVQAESASNLAAKVADTRAKEQSLVLRQRRVDRLVEQVENCVIKAPADGMVVYASSFDRRNDTPIQEGTQVRERQSLLRLPDTAEMKAVLRVQEAQVPKLRIGQRGSVKIVGVPKPVGAQLSRISVLADNSQRWWNPDLREYPVDLTLDTTPGDLKPGMGVQAEILVESIADALAVPLACVYSAGGRTFVFVRGGGKDQARDVTLGATNETHAQITRGIQEGDQVRILQIGEGQQLLEAAGIRIDPTTRPTNRRKPPGESAPAAQAAKPAPAKS